MPILVILRPHSSVYYLQKLRYRCTGRALKGRGKISMFARVTVNDSTLDLFLMVKLARNRWEMSCRSYFILNRWAATGVTIFRQDHNISAITRLWIGISHFECMQFQSQTHPVFLIEPSSFIVNLYGRFMLSKEKPLQRTEKVLRIKIQ